MMAGKIALRVQPLLALCSLLLSVGMLSCGNRNEGNTLIAGNGEPHARIRLEEVIPGAGGWTDSVQTGPEGSFRFALNLKETGFYLLRTGNGPYSILIVSPGDTLNLNWEPGQFPEQVVLKGPEDAVLLHEFHLRSLKRKTAVDSLQLLLESHRGDSLFVPLTLQTDSVFRAIWEEQREEGSRFIRSHPSSIGCLIVLDFTFGARKVLTLDEDLELYKMADSALSAQYPGNRHVVSLHSRITDFERDQKLAPAGKR